jgi:hypothetical protein
MSIPISKCERWLALVWFVPAGVLSLIFIIQSMSNKYLGQTAEAWQWFLPNLLPVLSLILGALVAEAMSGGPGARRIQRFYFRLTMGLSIVYLIAFALPILALPFVAVRSGEMIEHLKRSNLWLGPMQGLVSASLGIFFVKREAAQDD